MAGIKGVYIPQIDAKDLWISNYSKPDAEGYTLLDKNGNINKKRYKAVFDYSLDLMQLRDVYRKAYRNNRFSFIEDARSGRREYCDRIINVTFEYSVKTWNRQGKDTYIKLGFQGNELEWSDCLGRTKTGEIAGVKVGAKVNIPDPPDKRAFTYDEEKQVYAARQNIPCVQSVDSIRRKLYTDGFICNGTRYIRWKRSAGSARVGKCMFIDERLYSRMHTWEMCGLSIREGDKVDLAALQSYIALTMSSIIGTIELRPENFLVIDDYDSIFTEDCINVTEQNGKLHAAHENVEIANKIWDGQSLIDISAMGGYSDKGMILLRNRFFKSCAFSCNLQDWFRDNGVTDVSQLRGYTRANNIVDIKIVTTPSSIKYVKFGTLDAWFDQLYPLFGVVKYEKPPHYLGGRLVQAHYQLINSIQLERSDIEELLQPTFDFLDLCRDKPSVLKHWIKYKPQEIDDDPMLSKNDIIYKMMSVNSRFYDTKLYNDFKCDFIRSFIKNAKCGHIFVEGNYSVLCGNPIEMLLAAIGKFTGERVVGKDCVYSRRFEWGETILGSRSPHITASNVLITTNRQNEMIDRYMNPTEQIIYVNAIGENILQRLAGADYDSDTALITNNKTLIRAALKTTGMFKVAIYNVAGKKTDRRYTTEDMADLDIKTSNNLIGSIVNGSQELNTLMWHELANGGTYDDVRDIYENVCKLSILSNIEIDKAKKEFVIDSYRELADIRNEYKLAEDPQKLPDGEKPRTIKPWFFAHIVRQKGYYNPHTKKYTKFKTSMDYLQEAINSYKLRRQRRTTDGFIPFFEVINTSHHRPDYIDHNMIHEIWSAAEALKTKSDYIHKFSDDTESSRRELIDAKREFYEFMTSLQINKSTMISLLQSVESPGTSRFMKTLFYGLFSTGNPSLYNCIRDSESPIPAIVPDPDGDVLIYGYRFSEIEM